MQQQAEFDNTYIKKYKKILSIVEYSNRLVVYLSEL